jgi:hypothetical protein
MPKPKPPLLESKPGDVIAVSLGEGDYCYLRRHSFGYGVLPFLSEGIQRDARKFPSLTPAFFVHLWVYATDETPMEFIGNIPFASDEESWGRPAYHPPDAIMGCYRIEGVFNGVYSIIKPVSERDVAGLDRFHRYQPAELRSVLSSRRQAWDYIEASE